MIKRGSGGLRRALLWGTDRRLLCHEGPSIAWPLISQKTSSSATPGPRKSVAARFVGGAGYLKDLFFTNRLTRLSLLVIY